MSESGRVGAETASDPGSVFWTGRGTGLRLKKSKIPIVYTSLLSKIPSLNVNKILTHTALKSQVHYRAYIALYIIFRHI